MKKLYCDRCAQFIQDEWPNVGYQPPVSLGLDGRPALSFCSIRCAKATIQQWEEAAAHTALEHYLEVRKRNYGGLLKVIPVEEHLDGIWD